MNQNDEVSIDILVGLDNYWKFIKGGVFGGTGGLVAQETVWMDGDWVSVNQSYCNSVQSFFVVCT